MIKSKTFSFHDYGSEKLNMQHYGQPSPPLYNTTQIAETFKKFPSYLIAGGNDCLVSKHDLATLRGILEPTGARIEVIETFAHLDYVWGTESQALVFQPTVDFINDHTD